MPRVVLRSTRRATKLAEGLGAQHPRIRALDAELTLCPIEGAGPQPPPGSAECASLRKQRDEWLGAGKGEKHPQVVAIVARLAACP